VESRNKSKNVLQYPEEGRKRENNRNKRVEDIISRMRFGHTGLY